MLSKAYYYYDDNQGLRSLKLQSHYVKIVAFSFSVVSMSVQMVKHHSEAAAVRCLG